jgi:hypothetical protein
MISKPAQTQQHQVPVKSTLTSLFEHNTRWESGTTWKSALNNLRLLIQPFIFWCLLKPWLQVFPFLDSNGPFKTDGLHE